MGLEGGPPPRGAGAAQGAVRWQVRTSVNAKASVAKDPARAAAARERVVVSRPLELIRGLHNLRPEHHGCVATIGNYDGVLRGHQHMLEATRRRADELGLPVTVVTFEPPPREFFAVRAEETVRDAVRVSAGKGWHGPERHGRNTWRWSAGKAELRLHNSSGAPLKVAMSGLVGAGSGEQRLRVTAGERMLFGDTFGVKPGEMRFGLTLPAGETVLSFECDQPGRRIGTDPREENPALKGALGHD